MKKLYTLALTAAVALSAAAERQATVSNLEAVTTTSNLKVRTFTEAPASRAATDYSNYTWVSKGAGKYIASAMVDTYGVSADPASVTVYEASEQPGLYKVVGVWPDITDNAALIVDATDPNCVVVPQQVTPVTDNVDGITWIQSQSASLIEEGYDKATIAAAVPDVMITLADNVINIPVESLLLRWPEAPADSKYGTDAAKWYLGNEKSEGSIVLPGGQYVEPWTSLGDADVLENIVYGSFVGSVNTTVTKSEISVKTNTPGIYRLNDPLKALYAAQKWNAESPTMTIDATDPDNVLIEMTATGINGGADGLYSYFSQSWYDAEEGDETADNLRIKLTRDGDNATITFPIKSMLLFAAGSEKVYYAADAVSTIKFTEKFEGNAGVEDVTVSEAEGAVEYYNLQGVRLERPAAGVVIRVQGGKATKMLVK